MRRSIRRQLYLFAVYSGMRACWNLSRSRLQPTRLLNAMSHRAVLKSELLGELKLAVHSRPCPPSGDPHRRYGMISVRQCQPRINHTLYRYFCTTSHFGFGTLEIAFYERREEITFYAVRNTGRSNAVRLGFAETGRNLQLLGKNEDATLVHEVSLKLKEHGMQVNFARAEECLSLAISPGLLSATSSERTILALGKKYSRLHRAFTLRNTEPVRDGNREK